MTEATTQIAGRNALLASTFRHVDVPIEGVGTFRLRELSGAERDKFEVAIFNEVTELVDGKPVTRRKLNQLHLRANLVALCLVGEDNQRLFADDEVAQLSEGVTTAVLGELFLEAQKLNGLDGEAVEAAAKNSNADPTGASPSA